MERRTFAPCNPRAGAGPGPHMHHHHHQQEQQHALAPLAGAAAAAAAALDMSLLDSDFADATQRIQDLRQQTVRMTRMDVCLLTAACHRLSARVRAEPRRSHPSSLTSLPLLLNLLLNLLLHVRRT